MPAKKRYAIEETLYVGGRLYFKVIDTTTGKNLYGSFVKADMIAKRNQLNKADAAYPGGSNKRHTS